MGKILQMGFNFYASITLSATGRLQSLELDKLLSANSLFATIIGGLTQPIFNQRQIKTQKEVADAQQEQALLEFKQSLLVGAMKFQTPYLPTTPKPQNSNTETLKSKPCEVPKPTPKNF